MEKQDVTATDEVRSHEEAQAYDASDTAIDPAAERKVVWKLDTVVLPVILDLQLVSYLDRGNIGFAATQGMTKDIGLKGAELNAAVSVFYVLYIVAEFIVSLVVKRLGFGRFIPVITICWGLICMCTGFVQSYGGLIATRVLLGGAEGCLFPSLGLFILNWYKREEIATRIAFLFGSAAISGAFGGLIAYGIVQMNGLAGLEGWRWLYITEGLLTIFYGAACWSLIPWSFETAYFSLKKIKSL